MARRAIIWAAAFLLLWWVLTGPGFGGWYAGLLAALLAVLTLGSLAGDPIRGFRPWSAATFIPWFLVQAVRGGVDVSRRAMSPGLPLEPDTFGYSVRLPPGGPRTLFVNTISLLPGTFSAELAESRLTVHLLARDPEIKARLSELERRIGAVFGIDVDSVTQGA